MALQALSPAVPSRRGGHRRGWEGSLPGHLSNRRAQSRWGVVGCLPCALQGFGGIEALMTLTVERELRAHERGLPHGCHICHFRILEAPYFQVYAKDADGKVALTWFEHLSCSRKQAGGV